SLRLNSFPTSHFLFSLLVSSFPFLPWLTKGVLCLSFRRSTTTCVLTPTYWEIAFFRNIPRCTGSMTLYLRGSLGCCGNHFPRRPSPSWGWPNAGGRREPAWWLRNAARGKH